MKRSRTLVAVAIAGVMAIGLYLWSHRETPVEAPPPRDPAPVVTGPCAEEPSNEEAEPAEGPFESLAALCEQWRPGAECERVALGPLPAQSAFGDAYLVTRTTEGRDDDAGTSLLVFEVDGALFRWEVGRPFENVAGSEIEGRTAHDAHAYLLAKLVFERRFEHQPDNPEGPVQVITRQAWYACGVGVSGVPSCVEIPTRFRRETLRPGEEPTDVAETELAASFCDSGLLFYEGSTTRLTGRNAERVEALVGLSRLVFP